MPISRLVVAVAVLLAASTAAWSQTPAPEHPREKVGLTIYSAPQQPAAQYYNQGQVYNPLTGRYEMIPAGYALVKDWRKISLGAGTSVVTFKDVAGKIDATTVHFKSITDPDGTSVLEQNFEYDLVSVDKILSRYIDRPITLVMGPDSSITGRLLSFDPANVIIQTEDPSDPLRFFTKGEVLRNMRFSAIPGGLVTRPTLAWKVQTARPGEHLVKVTYETGGMSWDTDYTAVLRKEDKIVDLSGWVTIRNQSGSSYESAELKLVAGDLHRASPPGTSAAAYASVSKMRESADERTGFTEKSFFEYHLYTLGRKTSLADSSVKQIELFDPANGVPCRKVFVYYGAPVGREYWGQVMQDRNFGLTSNNKVDIYLEFKNSKDQGLGMPLPAGRVRVMKEDEADGSLELVGEDRIDHTPKDEPVRLKLGNAFDILGERKQTDFKCDSSARWIVESFEIRVRNHKDEDVDVIVKENLYRWVNWEIQTESSGHVKQDSRTVHFPIKVPKNGETTVTYTVKYTW